MKPEPMPCCSCCTNWSGDDTVVLISTTALPAWLATLITADSSVRLLLIGPSGATTVLPEGVTLMKRGASSTVTAAPTSAPTSALRMTTAIGLIPRRGLGWAGDGTGENAGSGAGSGDSGSVEGGRYCGSLAIAQRNSTPGFFSDPAMAAT